MEAHSLPIDVHYNKLLDWLIDRRHCDLRWHHQLQEVKRKIKNALSSLPNKEEPLISRVLTIEDVNYCDCTDVIEYLLTIESQDKNFIGQYTSVLLKEWDDILKSYEKKNLHLAEGGQLMCRLVNYEITSLKRQITKCQQLQKECTRKATDSQISARSLQSKFDEQCQELGIEGKDVHSELTQLLSTQLPVLFSEVVSLASNLEGAHNYYQIFRNCTLSSVSDEVLKLLNYFIKNGNVTVYQWENGSPPPEMITENSSMDKIIESHESTEINEATIDWGDLGEIEGEGKEEGGIDFREGKEEGESGIDFGDEIDFDISIDFSGITLEEDGTNNANNNKDKPFLTLLEDIDTRNLLLDQLSELFEFLKQRIIELSDSNNSSSNNVLQVELPSSVQAYSSDDVMEMCTSVKLVIDKLTSKRIQQLLLMLGSHSYLDRLSSQLLRQQELSQRAKLQIAQHTQRRQEIGEELLKHEQQLGLLVKETKRIKTMVSKEISKKYSNRTVNIIGEINQL